MVEFDMVASVFVGKPIGDMYDAHDVYKTNPDMGQPPLIK